MGSCLSSQALPARSTAADDVPANAGGVSSRFLTSSKRWIERKKSTKKEGGVGGVGGGGGGGIFGRRSVVAGGRELAEDELHRLPGRMFLNGASEVACLYTQQGRKGTNQDAMIVWENFTLRSDTIFCGVFDGHGPFGHMVAKKVRDSLPLKLSTQWRANVAGDNSPHQNGSASGSMNSEESASVSADDEWGESINVDENEKLPEMYLPLKQSFLKAFNLMDKELKLHPTIDCFCSGSTAVTVIKQ